MNQQFQSRIPKKTYWALVDKQFPETSGTLTHWMTRNTQQNKSKAHKNKVPNSKEARLHFKRIRDFDRYCLLEIELETGRHHQIRAQLASLGFPIQGDLKYGAPRSNKDGTISLHARTLTLQHPVTKETLFSLQIRRKWDYGRAFFPIQSSGFIANYLSNRHIFYFAFQPRKNVQI